MYIGTKHRIMDDMHSLFASNARLCTPSMVTPAGSRPTALTLTDSQTHAAYIHTHTHTHPPTHPPTCSRSRSHSHKHTHAGGHDCGQRWWVRPDASGCRPHWRNDNVRARQDRHRCSTGRSFDWRNRWSVTPPPAPLQPSVPCQQQHSSSTSNPL
jgi:hypothetical protein